MLLPGVRKSSLGKRRTGSGPGPDPPHGGAAALARVLLRALGMNNDMIRLGVLWKRATREGNRPFLTGPVRSDGIDAAVALLRKGGRFLILANKTKREGKNDPDCELFVVPDRNGGKGD